MSHTIREWTWTRYASRYVSAAVCSFPYTLFRSGLQFTLLPASCKNRYLNGNHFLHARITARDRPHKRLHKRAICRRQGAELAEHLCIRFRQQLFGTFARPCNDEVNRGAARGGPSFAHLKGRLTRPRFVIPDGTYRKTEFAAQRKLREPSGDSQVAELSNEVGDRHAHPYGTIFSHVAGEILTPIRSRLLQRIVNR